VATLAAEESQSVEEFLAAGLRAWLGARTIVIGRLVDEAGIGSGLTEDEAMELAIEEVRAVRATRTRNS